VTRTWTDTNGNYVPDCALSDFAANGECGSISNTAFGQPVINTVYDDEVVRGFGRRPYNWDLLLEVQRQMAPGVSATAGYYRNWFGNFRVTDNLRVGPQDYSPYCVTAPEDARLPGGGGYQICGLADVSLARFGQVSNEVVPASRFGTQTQTNDFISLTINARLPSGVRLTGGLDTGRTVADSCFVVDSPQQLLHCRVVTPFGGQTQVKLNGSYPLPGRFVVSAVYQNLSGAPVTASYAASNTEVARSLGRNLAACGTRLPCTSTATVPLVAPGTMYEDRITRLDLRLSKFLDLGSSVQLQANLDFYNVFNSSSILSVNTTYGSRWRQPTQIIDPRILQVSAQLNF
jgi:hypothetical protein